MQFRLLLSAAMVLTASSGLADEPQRIAPPGDMPTQLAPRRSVIPKPVYVTRPQNTESRLVVKFTDDSRMRLDGGGVRSRAGADISGVQAIADQFGLSFEPLIDLPADVIRAVETRAAIASGARQPDFQGLMYVNGNVGTIEAAANALNALGVVEYCEFMKSPVEHGGPGIETVAPLVTGAKPELLALNTLPAQRMFAPTPNFVDLQRHRWLFRDLNENGTIEVFGLDDDPTTFADNEFFGGFDMDYVNFIGQFMIDENLTRGNWNPLHHGGHGKTIRVGVIEGNADVGLRIDAHEELRHVILEPGQRLLPHIISGRNHGTATLGIITAKDQGLPGPDRYVEGDAAELGTIGMAPDAEAWFFPTASVSHPGGRLATAIVSAISFFDRGDVLSLSIGFPPGPLVQSPTIAAIFASGYDLGITSVMSAGNECFLLDDLAFWPEFETGAVVVGAGAPILLDRPDLLPYTREGFSNHHEQINTGDPDTDRVQCQAWGSAVVTLGYGDLQFTPTRRRLYTAEFGGTSSAAPMIAATAASIQGFAKMFYGIPISPDQVRGLLTGGFCQEGVCEPFEDFITGTDDPPEGNPCNPLFYYAPDTESDLIGNFPVWEGDGAIINSLFTGDFFPDETRIIHAQVLRGNHVYGNEITLRAADSNPLVVEAVFGESGRQAGTDPYPAPTYFFSGIMTDLAATALVLEPETVNAVQVTLRVKASHDGFAMLGCEAYNQVANRWDWIGQEEIFPVYHDEIPLANPTFGMNGRYVNRSNGELLLRVWVLQVGFGNGFFSAYDFIGLDSQSGGFGSGGG